ncbi:HAD-IA family hydrolase [Pectobacterium brasiliense]|uniref:HAD-IA family hydrolase n=1 Tax=Pectobacterium brasiliense TaxID=180957 RepID=UPI001968F675|nr:HAD family hydrolase [Pectobacterium brasiliense]
MIKLILFDLDDTLVDHHAGARRAIQEISNLMIKLNYADDLYDFTDFFRAYNVRNSALWSQFESGEIDIATLLEIRFIYIYDWFGVKNSDYKIIEELYWNTYVENCSLKSDWFPLLQQLSFNFPLVICSNGMEFIQRRKLKYTNTLSFFSRFYFGSHYPDCKPEPRFFTKILLDFKVQPESALMIGDSINNDILPCKNLGMKTLHYTGSDAFKPIKQSIMELTNG